MTGNRSPAWSIDLGRVVRLVLHRRVWLLKVNAAVAALAVGVVFVLPVWYASSVTLVPAPRDEMMLDLSGTGAGLGAMSLSLGSQPSPQDQLRMVVDSRAVADSLIQAFHLRERWKLKQMTRAREKLADCTSITTPKEGQVEVQVEARTRELARDLAAAYVRYAGLETVRLKSSLAAQRRIYLEVRLRELDQELALAAENVRGFEELHRAVSLPDQARATLHADGALQAQVALIETELAAARRYFTDSAPQVQALRDRSGELRRQIQRLEQGGDALLPGGEALPALKQEYLRLTREQTSLAAVSDMLRRYYEQARVEEANPVPSFSVLDQAELPERHSRPARALTVALSTAVSLAASLYYLLWRERREATVIPAAEIPEPARSGPPRKAEGKGLEAA